MREIIALLGLILMGCGQNASFAQSANASAASLELVNYPFLETAVYKRGNVEIHVQSVDNSHAVYEWHQLGYPYEYSRTIQRYEIESRQEKTTYGYDLFRDQESGLCVTAFYDAQSRKLYIGDSYSRIEDPKNAQFNCAQLLDLSKPFERIL